MASQGRSGTIAPAEIAGFRSETAVIRGVRVHYWIGGAPRGRPILLWHGFLGTSYSWAAVAPKLAAAGFAVIVPDMPGLATARSRRESRGMTVAHLRSVSALSFKASAWPNGRS